MLKSTRSINDTGYFSPLVNDYVTQKDWLKSLIQDFPSHESIKKQIELKQHQTIDRLCLVEVLKNQYSTIQDSEVVLSNINALLDVNTFSICTAHQPNVFTGFLYFIYKIVHAIKLSNECNHLYSNYTFVPIYYIGSEDNDLDEIGTFHYNQKTYTWNTPQQGACGRMLTSEMEDMLNEVLLTLNDQLPHEKNLKKIFKDAYNGINTLSQATRIIVHALFGQYGLVVIDADDSRLKSQFIDVMKDELFNQSSYTIVSKTIDTISLHSKVQASPRELNLFYLKDQLRERIERVGDEWHVVNTTIRFTREELLNELNQHPERFSPNVILRPLYQETILPNIAFVGGGGEIAYWLQLKSLFEYHKRVYPVLFLRNSILWINAKTSSLIQKIGFDYTLLFSSVDEILYSKISDHTALLKLKSIETRLQSEYEEIKKLSQSISDSLFQSMEAHTAKAQKIQTRIHQKFISHLKRNEEDLIERIHQIKSHLFPNNSLQERYDNFLSIYKQYGEEMIPELMKQQEGFGNDFIILTEE
jgi:bacillithiol biosynthesis cysteine-adding enzyme BshC